MALLLEGRFGNRMRLCTTLAPHKGQRVKASDLDDVVGGVFVIRGHVQANQDALTVEVPNVRQRLHKAPLPRRPLVVPPEPVSHDGPAELGLFQRLQHRLGVQLLQQSWNRGGGELRYTCGTFQPQLDEASREQGANVQNHL